MCNTQNSLLLNQHNGDDAPQEDYEHSDCQTKLHIHVKLPVFRNFRISKLRIRIVDLYIGQTFNIPGLHSPYDKTYSG